MNVLDALPPELWLQVFRWATTSPTLRNAGAYTPFENPVSLDPRDPALKVKHTLALVCHRWNTLISEFLYDDIHIRYGARGLMKVLDGQAGRKGYGESVHRMVLPYNSTDTTSAKPMLAVQILRLCRNLETLVRPLMVLSPSDAPRFEFEAESVLLPSLLRLEWWYNSSAERTGGINSLRVVLRNAPNLRYLFVGGAERPGRFRLESMEEYLHLPSLQTLRLYLASGMFLRQMLTRCSFPSVTHIVFDSPLRDDGMETAWEILGPQLQIVEFRRHARFLVGDCLTSCLRGCPNLETIHYYLFFTAIASNPPSHPSIKCIALHSAVNQMLTDGLSIWTVIESHFDMILGPTFPSLERIRLYGDWKAILSHPLFPPIYDQMLSRKCVIEVVG